LDAARHTVAQALETAEQIEDDQERTWALDVTAAAQAQAGDPDAARHTFTQALETAAQIEDDQQRASALGEIAAAQAQAGDLDAALETAAQIENDWQRAWALREIAKAQSKSGFGHESITTSTLIVTDQNEYLPAIAEALAEAGDKENFKRLLVPCAYYLDAAYKMCGLLAKLYPEQAKVIAAIVIGNASKDTAN
ncbi:MAG: hypothetical protein ACOC9Z_05050, partial [Chloroflexota bacterium]